MGPSVTLTALASKFTPLSIFCLASVENRTCFAAISLSSFCCNKLFYNR
ncbi:Uncharacterised protein [Vibrio cholerae]|nr:Uncharacterised protein [Vibrio cholerae]